MTRFYYCEETYDCPQCIREDEEGNHYGVLGAFEVEGKILPGEEPTYYPNDKAHPGCPPEVYKVINIRAVGEPCRHAEDEDVHEELAKMFTTDFDNGDIEPELDIYEPEYDPADDINEWEGET